MIARSSVHENEGGINKTSNSVGAIRVTLLLSGQSFD
jgi:hypothetical protein